VFMGYGPLQGEIESAAAANSHIRFQSAVSPGEVLEFTASAHLGVCLIADSCLSYRLCLPNKLFEYSMAGLPVLCSDLPEMATLVRENGIGFLADPADPERLTHALRNALSANLPEYGKRARAFSRKFCWENQEPVILRAYWEHVIR